MITLQQFSLRRGRKLLLEDTNLTVFAKQKVGLIGDNGCGKSTLFATLQGDIPPDQGTLFLPNGLTITQVKQEIPTTDQAAIDYVIDGDKHYRMLQNTLLQAEKAGDLNKLANCHDQLAAIDGYAIEGKAEKILRGLGFHRDDLKKPTIHFSGGWRMRLNLAQALMSRAELTLLDEPTNHLDVDAIIWLEKWLQEYPGTLFVISHDREFLDNTIDHILHFENRQLRLYKGNYSAFETQQAAQMAVQQAAYAKQQAQISHIKSFVDRFKAKASKARQAQSRLKALEKMELISIVHQASSFHFSFKTPQSCPNPLLRIEKAYLGYKEDLPVLMEVDIQIAPSDRIGLLGMNGAGKSTFIKSLAGTLVPLKGQIHFYKGIKIGYFAQHQIEHLDLSLSPLAQLQLLSPNENEQTLRNFLGSFNFSGDMAKSSIEHFSGGEKARLALALIVWQAPNLLLLDEPTNHLDMKMREALMMALQDYEGALLLVSHDRHLMRTTINELIVVKDKRIEQFKGDLDDYKAFLLKTSEPKEKKSKTLTSDLKKERRQLETKRNLLEKELLKLNNEKMNLENSLADSTLYNNHNSEQISTLQQQRKHLLKKIETTESLWLKVSEELEALA